MRGKFISFEGGEGCGKSTMARRLAAELEKRGIATVLTREPGGTWLGEEIRHLLKDQDRDPPTARSELLLFLAARSQLVTEIIEPALAAGKWVISDRFSDSTLAYQGYGRGLDLQVLKDALEFATGGLKPDRTLLLDVRPEVAIARRVEREQATATASDRFERAGSNFHRRLREGFLALAAAEPERIVVIDANADPETVWQRVLVDTLRMSMV